MRHRQWALNFPHPLLFLFGSRPATMTAMLGIIYRAIATHLIHVVYPQKTAHTGAVTLIQQFGSAMTA